MELTILCEGLGRVNNRNWRTRNLSFFFDAEVLLSSLTLVVRHSLLDRHACSIVRHSAGFLDLVFIFKYIICLFSNSYFKIPKKEKIDIMNVVLNFQLFCEKSPLRGLKPILLLRMCITSPA